MQPRFVGRLGLADAITVANAVLGFVAAVAATVDPALAARLVLLGAVLDGLDGVVARHAGSTPVGTYLDSLSDVATFGVAPALLVTAVAIDGWGLSTASPSLPLAVAIGVPAVFVGMVVVRLGIYTAFDADETHTRGVPSTLAATVLAAAVLSGFHAPSLVVGGTAVLSYLMVTRISYPDLLARDALLMGVVQAGAILVPGALDRAFPFALLVLAVAYLVLAPRFYWGPLERPNSGQPT